ncbi:glutamate synthase subunit beta [Roseivirga sp. E12]|uniref:glutamate synthase subunit beta n=1 Tax=Roseivirga sp. E12 TaxID=2819237 RepID=UPI001ABC9368|nr:glutamate synthase subunit beta [Roseivirga sp. E12]MBO3697417.1 glutamate synthase subunit beta [Roseivirga sp. E12]
MGDVTGFLKHDRLKKENETPESRVNHFKEFAIPWSERQYKDQASRCMDCGVPFCQSGCPLGNKIPDFNDAVYRGEWKEAWQVLKSTNNFPEFTGRICPAPCEASCVLGLNSKAVNIEHIEKEISERAFLEGWEQPIEKVESSGFAVAVVGSGPAGLASAEELNKEGHKVTIYERDREAGGLLRYGIPDFKLEKRVVERRVSLMKEVGISFKTGVEIGRNISALELKEKYDSVILCTGSTVPRDLAIEGRTLDGVHYAMDFLKHQNQLLAIETQEHLAQYNTKGKRVVVIGGGDTGADCVGTSNRQGAEQVTQIELLEKPSLLRLKTNPWPEWPMILSTSTSHEEGVDRDWAILTKRFVGKKGKLTGVETIKINWVDKDQFQYEEVPGTENLIPCDMAFLAIGFSHTEHKGLVSQFGLKLDVRGNIHTNDYQTSEENVFAAGDCRRGQSLVVWAIAEGRKAANAVCKYLELNVAEV